MATAGLVTAMPISAEDRKRYSADWPQISRRIRFERAGGRCECQGECGVEHHGRCGARHGEAHPVTGSMVILTTAHLDHVPENLDDLNLKALCQRCHLRYDRHHHAANARLSREAKRRRILDKAGQLAFETAIFGPSVA